MAIFRPPAIEGDGIVEVMPVIAHLTLWEADRLNAWECSGDRCAPKPTSTTAADIPFTIIFDASQSLGENMSLTIEGPESPVPVTLLGTPTRDLLDKADPDDPDEYGDWYMPEWSSIPIGFTRRGDYTITLRVFGGTEQQAVVYVITALPPTPEESENMIIRAISINATQQDHNVIGTTGEDGDQV